MTKKLLAIVLSLILLIAMTACSGGKEIDGTSDTEEVVEEVVEEVEEPYTVAIQVVTLPGTEFAGQEDREAAINAIIEPAINCNIDIQEVWISELNQTTSLAVVGGEKLDLLHVGTVSRLSSMIGTEILKDMNENNMLQDYGQGLISLFGKELLDSGEVNGQQLAIPAKTFNASAKGLYYNKTMADEYGIEVPEKMSSVGELTSVLEEVKNKVPDVIPFFSGSGELIYLGWMNGYSAFGNLATYGAIMDEGDELVVENLFATDVFKDYVVTLFEWTEKGLQPGDPTDSSTSQAYFGASKLFCVPSNINEKIKADIESGVPEIEVGWIEMVEPRITNSNMTEFMWGVSSSSERPEKAIEFLNFLYTNADVANILHYGLEGVNYTIAEGSEDIAIINGSYLPVFYEGGNTSDMHIKAPAGPDYIEKSEALEAEAIVSSILGYSFDDSEFQTESSVLNTTVKEYLPQLTNGMADSVEEILELLNEFNEQLESSGISDVIEANQEQIDTYINGK